MQTPGVSRVPKVKWLVLATVVLMIGGTGLRWWMGRKTIREIRRLGGWYAVSSSSWIPQPLHQVLPFDAFVERVTFQGSSVPDEFFERLANLHGLRYAVFIKCTVSDAALKRLREVPTLFDLVLDESEVTDATAMTLKQLG